MQIRNRAWHSFATMLVMETNEPTPTTEAAESGTPVAIKANKAVVLTTGGEAKAMLLLIALCVVAVVAARVVFPKEVKEELHEELEELTELGHHEEKDKQKEDGSHE